MARGTRDSRGSSPSALLSQVDYPISRDELATAAAESELDADAVNFVKSLPDRIYQSPSEVLREFAEAEARFGMGTRDVRHRGDLGKKTVEPGDHPTRHP